MRSLVGGAALICGSLTGAAIASLLFLGPTLGVSPFGHDAPQRAPRTFDLPLGLSGQAQLSRHNRAGALVATEGAALATGGISELPVGGGSATGGPTVLRPGGAARVDRTSGAPVGARRPFGGLVTGSGSGGARNPTIGPPTSGGPSEPSGAGNGSQADGQGAAPAASTPAAGDGDQTPSTSTGTGDTSGTSGASTSGTSGASTSDPTPVTPPPAKTHGNGAAALEAKAAGHGRDDDQAADAPADTAEQPGESGDGEDAAPPTTDSSKKGRGTGYDQARGRHDDGGDGRGGRHGRGSGEGSDS